MDNNFFIIDEKNYNGKGNIKYVKDEECWICIHPKSKKEEYLVVTRNNIQYYIHRYIYELYNGKIKKGMVIMHICDNPKCINPSHLKMGTQQDNIDDMHNKGRAIQSNETRNKRSLNWKGKNNPMYGKKPKSFIDIEIRKLIRKEIMSRKKEENKKERIMKKYNISQSTYYRIKKEKYLT